MENPSLLVMQYEINNANELENNSSNSQAYIDGKGERSEKNKDKKREMMSKVRINSKREK